MKDEEINRAIAEACGKRWHQPTPEEFASGSYYHYAPNYCDDSKAVESAKRFILNTPEMQVAFMRILFDVAKPSSHLRGTEGYWHVDYQLLNTTPREQSEAIVRTIGKWQESPVEKE